MSIVGTINVANLVDLTYRANLMFDNASTDPTEFVETLSEAVDAYLTARGEETLQDDICGAVNAVMAAAGVVEITQRTSPAAAEDEDPNERLSTLLHVVNVAAITLDAAAHAVMHNDPMAVECFPDGGTHDEWLVNLTDWVPSHLPEFDADAFLASFDLEAALVGSSDEDQDTGPEPENGSDAA